MRVFRLLGLALVILLGVLLARTFMFTLDQGPLPEAVTVKVDEAGAVSRFSQALCIPTVTRGEAPKFDPSTFDALQAHLRQSFPKAFTTLSTETVNRHTLLMTWRGSDPSLAPVLLMAHQDVVPVDPSAEADWTHPPFAGEVAEGYVWGRGALDVKMGVMGILEAVEGLITTGHAPKRTLYLAFGHDEEIGGEEGAKAVAALLKSRGVQLAWVLDEGGAIVQGVIPGVAGPVALIGVAEKGYTSLRISAKGTGGHSSMPPAQTAVGIVAQAVTKLEQSPFPARMNHAGRFFSVVGPKMPFDKRVIFSNLWLFEPLVMYMLSGNKSMNASLRTTTAVTMFKGGVKDNVLPANAEAVVNFRILPGDTPESVMLRVKAVIDDPRVSVEGAGDGFSVPPSPVSDPKGVGFETVGRAIRGIAQDPELIVAPYLVVGATDSRYFQGIADNVYRFLPVRLSPEDVARIHGTDERIAVKNYLEVIRFYSQLIRLADNER